MNIPTKALLALCAVALTLLSVLWAQRDARLRAEGRAEVFAAQVDSLNVEVERYRVEVQHARRLADSVKVHADSVITEAEAEIEAVRQTRPTIVERVVREAGADSAVVRAAVAEVSASYEAEIDRLEARDVQRLTVITAQAEEVATLRQKDRVSEALIESLRSQVNAVTRSRPGWLERNTSKAFLVAGGVAVGLLAAEVVR